MIVVWPETEASREKAHLLAQKLRVPMVEHLHESSFYLKVSTDHLELLHLEPGEKRANGIIVDFCTGPMKQLAKSATWGQPLAKAIGKGAKNQRRRVVDATAGLGKDTLFLAAIGCDVVSVEKNPVIFSLLEDGYQRALSDDVMRSIFEKHVRIKNQDSIEYLKSLSEQDLPDVVYIDPMFPESKKSSLPKKEMQIFRAFLRGDGNETKLLEIALEKAKERVVVKRPSWASPLLEPVHNRYDGKLVSYDSYLKSSINRRYI